MLVMIRNILIIIILLFALFASCKKETTVKSDKLAVTFEFNENQQRLDGFGNPSTVSAGNSAQSPNMKLMSANYVELIPTALTGLGEGEIIYQGAETTAGGGTAINFSDATLVNDGGELTSMLLSDVAPGTYEYVRVSLSYQQGEIDLRASGLDLKGTLASFLGYNQYITNHTIVNNAVTVNANRLQGFWAFETQFGISSGQAPPGATTVPNPIFATSPIPQGSCLVTGKFDPPLVIPNESNDNITINLSFSTNNSFEWKDDNNNGIYEPLDGDTVVDMGVRGLIPTID